jgi:integrase
MNKRHHGAGSIDERGENSWRLRYRIDGKRYAQTFHGTLPDARKKLRELIHSGDTGAHIEPAKITVAEWIEQWIAIGCPGQKQKRAGRRSIERYAQLLRGHVVPVLGHQRLQQLQPAAIDKLYVDLATASTIAPKTQHSVHTVFGACLGTATRKGLLSADPMLRVEQIPSGGESDHGVALDADQLRQVIDGFRGSALFALVATAALTGARRNEILALRWTDFDPANCTLRIERALEETKAGLSFKEPKTKRGVRVITLDSDLVALLLAEREKYQRLVAGVPDGATVDLSLIKLPDDALIFPSPIGATIDLTQPRDPRAVSKTFITRARKLGFKGLRFHDLRGAHETALLDSGVPVHVVAARCGHSPSVLLQNYAKRTRKADTSAAAVIGNLSKGILS